MAASSNRDPVQIVPLPDGRAAEAALVLAAAFAGNPLHVALFGRHVLTRNEAFFRERLLRASGPWVAALEGARIVGVIHWVVEEDAEPPRVTLGPLGVSPDARRRGIGSRLMAVYCAEVDAHRRTGYLETDQLSNLAFYRRFEFAAMGEFDLNGVVHYVMWRPALI